MEHLACHVLVVGSGAAGLRAAIAARESGLEVLVVSKSGPGKATCTWLSAGVMAGSPPGGRLDEHFEQTLQAGRGINQRELVEILVAEAPPRLQELLAWGIRAEFLNGYLFAQGHAPALGLSLAVTHQREFLTGQFLFDPFGKINLEQGLIGNILPVRQ